MPVLSGSGVMIIVRQRLLANVLCEALAGDLQVDGSYRNLAGIDLEQLGPAAIVLDLDTCENNVPKSLRKCRDQSPGTRICVLVSSADDPRLRYCIEERVEGCIVTDVPFNEILDAVRAVTRGDSFIDRRISRQLLVQRSPLSAQDRLSAREEEIVRMVVQGLANKEIAHDLKLSQSTVKNHISRIFEKLSVTSRTEAAVLAVKVGLI